MGQRTETAAQVDQAGRLEASRRQLLGHPGLRLARAGREVERDPAVPFRRAIIAAVLAPYAVSEVIAVIIWKYMLGSEVGIVRQALSALGIPFYNEIPTKVNWQYCTLGFDLRTMKYTHFQCNDVVYDMSGKGTLEIEAMPNLRGMLNVVFFCESDADKRSCLYVDSVCVSGEWQ